MADGSGGSGSGGVPGAGGVNAAPGNVAGGVGGVPPACPVGTAGCPGNHWVKAEVRFIDTQEPVRYEEGEIKFNGVFTIDPGPLYNGVLGAKDLPAGVYFFTLPHVDANEWWEG